MKVSKNFELIEFVDPYIYNIFGDKSLWFLDQRLFEIAQWIRDYFDRETVINGMFNGNRYTESGLRRFDTNTGAKYSSHKYGRAIDIKVKCIDSFDVQGTVKENWNTLRQLGLTTMERDTNGWTHLDTRNTGLDYLFIV